MYLINEFVYDTEKDINEYMAHRTWSINEYESRKKLKTSEEVDTQRTNPWSGNVSL